MFNKKRMIEVWDNTKGTKAALLENIMKEENFDLKYEGEKCNLKYYRLKADRNDVQRLKNYLGFLGYGAVLMNNKYFLVYE